MAQEQESPGEIKKASTDRPDEPNGFELLAARLDAIAERAVSEHWPHWSEEDTRAVLAAAREVEGIRAVLAEGMRQAFEIGREYGHGEELLDRLNWEIDELSDRMARRAWGGGKDVSQAESDWPGGVDA
jgi:hypothetical protein